MTDSPLFTSAAWKEAPHKPPTNPPHPPRHIHPEPVVAGSLTTFKSRTPSLASCSRLTNFIVRRPKLFSWRLGVERTVSVASSSIFSPQNKAVVVVFVVVYSFPLGLEVVCRRLPLATCGVLNGRYGALGYSCHSNRMSRAWPVCPAPLRSTQDPALPSHQRAARCS